MSAPHHARCLGQRILSPYRGVMHSVVTRWADAVTTDGLQWTLYVRGECLYEDRAELANRAISVPDVKYGTWSRDTGFHRAPIRLPTFDTDVRREGEGLLAAVQRHADDLPFPLADRFELWLLHGETGWPLALIASACSAGDCEAPACMRWTPGQACMADLPEAVQLNRLIAELAGSKPRADWFERHADGSGSEVSPGASGRTSPARHLPAERFAPLFIDGSALGPGHGHLIEALHHWQAPVLLQLPNISTKQRRQLEAAACSHALRLAEHLPLYPLVLDSAAVTAALVEARLRRSQPPRREDSEASQAMSPDYIEIPGD